MAADVVFYAPPGELLADADEHVEDLRAHPNPEKRKRRRRRDWVLDESALEHYGEWRTLLVRTALIRARGYDPDNQPELSSFAQVLPHVQHLRNIPYEIVLTFCLNSRNRLLAIHEAAKGGAHGAAVIPRDVLTVPLLVGASAFILAHNHPSGDPMPSPDDVAMTRHLREAADLIGVPLLDHVVVGHTSTASIMDLLPDD